MKTFELEHLTIEYGKKEAAQGTIPSCCVCKEAIYTGLPYVCLRPDGYIATRPKYPTYFCFACWQKIRNAVDVEES